MREPDWEALSDLQFLLYNRIADSLNAALSAIALSDMPEASGKVPGEWKERASDKIANVLNLATAWSNLIRFKMETSIPDHALRPFPVNELLAWLGRQLQLSAMPVLAGDPMLHASQETLQEALLLLYSAAFTQGTNVRLELETSDRGIWFRVKFMRVKPQPSTFDELLKSFSTHWRDRDTVFELTTARDFVRLNGSKLALVAQETQGAFEFFIWRAGVRRDDSLKAAAEKTTISSVKVDTGRTGVIAETDLPQQSVGEKNEDSKVEGATITSATPLVTPPMTRKLSGDDTLEDDDDEDPRLADVRPAHYPLPVLEFDPDTPTGTFSGPVSPEEAWEDADDDEAASGDEAESTPPPAEVSLAGSQAGEPGPDVEVGGLETPVIPELAGQPPGHRYVTVEPLRVPDGVRPDADTVPDPEQAADDVPVIVPAGVPRPEPPLTFRSPPAATSNVALMGDTRHPLKSNESERDSGEKATAHNVEWQLEQASEHPSPPIPGSGQDAVNNVEKTDDNFS